MESFLIQKVIRFASTRRLVQAAVPSAVRTTSGAPGGMKSELQLAPQDSDYDLIFGGWADVGV
ncbi:MAG: hypothetical protein V4719_24130 [Planctomycetota bacterium]